MILSLIKFLLTFETFFSHDMCSFATGENFNLVYTFLFFLGWGITTAVLTFRVDSPFANLVRVYDLSVSRVCTTVLNEVALLREVGISQSGPVPFSRRSSLR